MKYEYGVVCLIRANGQLNVHVVNVVAENETDAKDYAINTVKAQGYSDVFVGPDLPNPQTGKIAKAVENNGIATEESIKQFENYCSSIGVKIK